MKIRSNLDVILLLLACLGGVAAIALVSVAGLHGTRLDTMESGGGPLHGSGWIVAIPVVVGALAFLLLVRRHRRRPCRRKLTPPRASGLEAPRSDRGGRTSSSRR